jgi:hypothetical protein
MPKNGLRDKIFPFSCIHTIEMIESFYCRDTHGGVS